MLTRCHVEGYNKGTLIHNDIAMMITKETLNKFQNLKDDFQVCIFRNQSPFLNQWIIMAAPLDTQSPYQISSSESVESAIDEVNKVPMKHLPSILLDAAMEDVQSEMLAEKDEHEEVASIEFKSESCWPHEETWKLQLKQHSHLDMNVGDHRLMSQHLVRFDISTSRNIAPHAENPFGLKMEVKASVVSVTAQSIIFVLEKGYEVVKPDALQHWYYKIEPKVEEPTLEMCRELLKKDKENDGRTLKHILRVSFDPSKPNVSLCHSMKDSVNNLQGHEDLKFAFNRLDVYQHRVVEEALKRKHGVMVISGPPGTGKSNTMVVLASCKANFRKEYRKILYICPSNSAGSTFLRALLENKDATTILKPLRIVAKYMQHDVASDLLPYCLHYKVQEVCIIKCSP